MKKYLSFLMLATLLACNNNSETPLTAGVTIKATPQHTRTSFDGTNSAWSAGDKLQVAVGATGETLTVHEFVNDDPAAGLFTNSTLTLDSGLSYDIYALYSAQNTVPTAASADVLIGAATQQQTGASASHIAVLDPLYGKATGVQTNNVSIGMSHTAVALQINIENTTEAEIAGVKSVTITVPDGVQLYGTGTIYFATDAITMGSDGSNFVTVNVQDSGAIAVGETFGVWAATAPFAMAEGSVMHFSITTTDDEVLEYRKSFEAATLFNAGVIMSTTIAPTPRPEEIVIKWGYLEGYTTPEGMPSCESDSLNDKPSESLVNQNGVTSGSYPTEYGNITIESAVKYAYVSRSEFIRFRDITATDNAYICLPKISGYKLTQVVSSIPSSLVDKRTTLRVAIDPAASSTAKNTTVQNATFDLVDTSSDQQYKIRIYSTNNTLTSYDLTGIQLTYVLE